METELRCYFLSSDYIYVELPVASMVRVYDLFLGGQMFQPETGLEYLYLGTYYKMTGHTDQMLMAYQAGQACRDEGSSYCVKQLLLSYLESDKQQAVAYFQSLDDTNSEWACLIALQCFPAELSTEQIVRCCRQCWTHVNSWWPDAADGATRRANVIEMCHYYLSQLPDYSDYLRQFASEKNNMAYDFLVEDLFLAIDWSDPTEASRTAFLTWAEEKRTRTSLTYLGSYYKKKYDWSRARLYLSQAVQQGCILATLNYAEFLLGEDKVEQQKAEQTLICLASARVLTAPYILVKWYYDQNNPQWKAWAKFILLGQTCGLAHFYLGEYYVFKNPQDHRGWDHLQRAAPLEKVRTRQFLSYFIDQDKISESVVAGCSGLELALSNRWFDLALELLDKYAHLAGKMEYLTRIPTAGLRRVPLVKKLAGLHQYQVAFYQTPTYFTKWIVLDVMKIIRRYLE